MNNLTRLYNRACAEDREVAAAMRLRPAREIIDLRDSLLRTMAVLYERRTFDRLLNVSAQLQRVAVIEAILRAECAGDRERADRLAGIHSELARLAA